MSSIAIIDLGTNTFHLLIAEVHDGTFQIIHRERQAVKLGKGGINRGRILPEALDRGVKALRGFKSTLINFDTSSTFAFGTSALRTAHNRQEILDQIRNETGFEVEIISGEREAELIYHGVRAALDLGMEQSLIMDIGGGSVEFIIANRDRVFWKQSFEIGAQRLLEQFQKNDPIRKEEIRELENYLSTTLQSLLQSLNEHKPKTLVGSSGTFDTLSDIYCIRVGIHKNEHDPETPLTLQAFREVYFDLIIKGRSERLQIPGMIEMRVDMIVVACVLVKFIIDRFDFKGIRVSSYSLKEGALSWIASKK